ncbi:MAG: energy-coupling factor transporter transmembrane protein EcfT [Actinomycetia bacterium]|nr:energy-coupling factor transporter transmembrane protein EcfT [Actinomycetes bacterium]
MTENTFSYYWHGSSLIHRIDPRAKLIAMALLIAAMFSSNSFWGLALLAAFDLALWLLSRIPAAVAWRNVWPLLILALLPLLFNLFFISGGNELWHAGPLLITDAGVYQACYMSLRLFLMFTVALLLPLTSTPLALAQAIGRFLRPLERLRVPAYEISLMVGIALRFIPDIAASFNQVRRAQAARGANIGRGRSIERLRALAACLIPLFSQVFRHAEALALAMESRCYHGGSQRSYYRQTRIGSSDVLALAVCLLLLGAVVTIRVVC